MVFLSLLGGSQSHCPGYALKLPFGPLTPASPTTRGEEDIFAIYMVYLYGLAIRQAEANLS